MKVIDYMIATYKNDEYNVRPKVICADGFEISIQGGTRMHYCHPRELCNIYYDLELGFPSKAEEKLIPFMEGEIGKTDPTDTVYGGVPMAVVEDVVESHGGIVGYWKNREKHQVEDLT